MRTKTIAVVTTSLFRPRRRYLETGSGSTSGRTGTLSPSYGGSRTGKRGTVTRGLRWARTLLQPRREDDSSVPDRRRVVRVNQDVSQVRGKHRSYQPRSLLKPTPFKGVFVCTDRPTSGRYPLPPRPVTRTSPPPEPTTLTGPSYFYFLPDTPNGVPKLL